MASAEKKAYPLPLIYRLVFLFVEPAVALVRAYYIHSRPGEFLAMTHAGSAVGPVPTATVVALSQFGNLYLLFAVNLTLVLRSTGNLRVWRALLIGLLIADIGHLYCFRPLGASIYWDVTRWNILHLANIPLAYACAALRIAFLAGVGLEGRTSPNKRQ